MNSKKGLSVVVPTLNEAGNIDRLLQRLHAPLTNADIPYEVIIVDDHSSDDTVKIAEELAGQYPVTTQLKQGKRGKAYSLLEGFDHAKHELVAMIDADLQYPPEEIATMYALLEKTQADVVVTKRHNENNGYLRQLITRIYNLIFARLLFGINYDTQSGLKLFKKRILNNFVMTPSPWSFDLEFLVRALENKFKIVSHDITFYERTSGVTKIKLFSATYEIAAASFRLRWNTSMNRLREGHRLNNSFLKKAFPVAALAFMLSVTVFGPSQQANAASNTAASTQTTSGGSSASASMPAIKQAPAQASTLPADHSKLAAVTNNNNASIYRNSEQVPSSKTVHSLTNYSRIGLLIGGSLILLSVLLLTKDSYKRFIASKAVTINRQYSKV